MSSESATAGAQVAGAEEKRESLLAFADALLFADKRERSQTAIEMRQYVTFLVRDVEIGIPILQCREIVRISTITRVPESPAHVRGVVNMRGHILPAVDARQCLGLESTPLTAKSRLIVVEVSGRLLALIVDRVTHILKLSASDIEPSSGASSVPGATGMARVGGTVIHLMDVEQMLRAEPAVQAKAARSEEA
jgi:purine-binding chemotaxis protein CheW